MIDGDLDWFIPTVAAAAGWLERSTPDLDRFRTQLTGLVNQVQVTGANVAGRVSGAVASIPPIHIQLPPFIRRNSSTPAAAGQSSSSSATGSTSSDSAGGWVPLSTMTSSHSGPTTPTLQTPVVESILQDPDPDPEPEPEPEPEIRPMNAQKSFTQPVDVKIPRAGSLRALDSIQSNGVHHPPASPPSPTPTFGNMTPGLHSRSTLLAAPQAARFGCYPAEQLTFAMFALPRIRTSPEVLLTFRIVMALWIGSYVIYEWFTNFPFFLFFLTHLNFSCMFFYFVINSIISYQWIRGRLPVLDPVSKRQQRFLRFWQGFFQITFSTGILVAAAFWPLVFVPFHRKVRVDDYTPHGLNVCFMAAEAVLSRIPFSWKQFWIGYVTNSLYLVLILVTVAITGRRPYAIMASPLFPLFVALIYVFVFGVYLGIDYLSRFVARRFGPPEDPHQDHVWEHVEHAHRARSATPEFAAFSTASASVEAANFVIDDDGDI